MRFLFKGYRIRISASDTLHKDIRDPLFIWCEEGNLSTIGTYCNLGILRLTKQQPSWDQLSINLDEEQKSCPIEPHREISEVTRIPRILLVILAWYAGGQKNVNFLLLFKK